MAAKPSKGKQFKAISRPYFYQLCLYCTSFAKLKKCREQPQRRKDEPLVISLPAAQHTVFVPGRRPGHQYYR